MKSSKRSFPKSRALCHLLLCHICRRFLCHLFLCHLCPVGLVVLYAPPRSVIFRAMGPLIRPSILRYFGLFSFGRAVEAHAPSGYSPNSTQRATVVLELLCTCCGQTASTKALHDRCCVVAFARGCTCAIGHSALVERTRAKRLSRLSILGSATSDHDQSSQRGSTTGQYHISQLTLEQLPLTLDSNREG